MESSGLREGLAGMLCYSIQTTVSYFLRTKSWKPWFPFIAI